MARRLYQSLILSKRSIVNQKGNLCYLVILKEKSYLKLDNSKPFHSFNKYNKVAVLSKSDNVWK